MWRLTSSTAAPRWNSIKDAKVFTARVLQKPFAIYTRWRPVFGPTRYYAMVVTGDGDDLAKLLVRNGLARIYGTRTPLPDGRTSRQYLARMSDLNDRQKLLASALDRAPNSQLKSHGVVTAVQGRRTPTRRTQSFRHERDRQCTIASADPA